MDNFALYTFGWTIVVGLVVASVGGLVTTAVLGLVAHTRSQENPSRIDGWVVPFRVFPFMWITAGVALIVGGLICVFTAKETQIGVLVLGVAIVASAVCMVNAYLAHLFLEALVRLGFRRA